MEWIDGNIGSKVTSEVPGRLDDREARQRAGALRIASPAMGQHQDTGAKMWHSRPTRAATSSQSVARKAAARSYRGLVQVNKGCARSRSR